MDFINTGIYVRVSTEEQRDYGYSIEAQLRELRNYCNQRNLNIIHEYNDDGYSSKDYEIYSYNELTKNYSQDRKTFDLIQNKFQDLNLNLMMVIDNNKFVDSLILFERVRP